MDLYSIGSLLEHLAILVTSLTGLVVALTAVRRSKEARDVTIDLRKRWETDSGPVDREDG